MPWVRLDDSFADHPKIVGLSDTAFRAHVSALCYCNRHLTDGAFPVSALANVSPTASAELVKAGLWSKQVASGCFAIHDYLDYQPTRERVRGISEVRKESGRRGGKASGQARREEANAKQVASSGLEAKTKPVPNPNPSTSTRKQRTLSSAPSRTEGEKDLFKALWEALVAEGVPAPSGANGSARSGYTQILWGLVDEHATPAQIHEKCAAYRVHDTLGQTMLSLPSLTKWWETLNGAGPQQAGVDRLRRAMAERGIE